MTSIDGAEDHVLRTCCKSQVYAIVFLFFNNRAGAAAGLFPRRSVFYGS